MPWEYYRLATVESSLDDALQSLGQDGWELVTVMPETRLFHGYQCLFKRPCAAAAESDRNKTPSATARYSKRVAVG